MMMGFVFVDCDGDMSLFLLICLFMLVEEQMGAPLVPLDKYSQSIGMREVVVPTVK